MTIRSPIALIVPAESAGIKVPPDVYNYNPNEYKKWSLFCSAQLNCELPVIDCEWHNAVVIANLTDTMIQIGATWQNLVAAGFRR